MSELLNCLHPKFTDVRDFTVRYRIAWLIPDVSAHKGYTSAQGDSVWLCPHLQHQIHKRYFKRLIRVGLYTFLPVYSRKRRFSLFDLFIQCSLWFIMWPKYRGLSPSYQHMASHHKGETVLSTSYLYNGNLYTRTDGFLYWNGVSGACKTVKETMLETILCSL